MNKNFIKSLLINTHLLSINILKVSLQDKKHNLIKRKISLNYQLVNPLSNDKVFSFLKRLFQEEHNLRLHPTLDKHYHLEIKIQLAILKR